MPLCYITLLFIVLFLTFRTSSQITDIGPIAQRLVCANVGRIGTGHLSARYLFGVIAYSAFSVGRAGPAVRTCYITFRDFFCNLSHNYFIALMSPNPQLPPGCYL